MFGLGFGELVGIFKLIVAVLAVLMPFFVLRIRNEMISLNRKMEILVTIAQEKHPPPPTGSVKTTRVRTAGGNIVRICGACGMRNRDAERACTRCGQALVS